MTVGEGCRRSFLVDDWGWQQVQKDFVAVNREREKGRGKGENIYVAYTRVGGVNCTSSSGPSSGWLSGSLSLMEGFCRVDGPVPDLV